MAEDEDLDLQLAPEDAGAVFRAEMAATNFFMGYWPQILGVLIVGLLGVFFYGQYGSYVQHSQRAIASRIADVERDLTAASTDDDRVGAAAQLEAIGSASSGTASIEARLKAAELYRRAGETDKRRAVLESASEDSTGLLHFAAESSLAAMDLNADHGAAAIGRYRKLADDSSDYLAQEASIELARALEVLGRVDEADKVYGDFLSRWPDSPRAAEVESSRALVGSAG